MNISGRYAPTPSGSLHLGNLRTALAAWCQIRQLGGQFFLRFDDLDETRALPDKFEEHQRDLRRLGLNWDGDVIYQSQRKIDYQQFLQQLIERDFIYPCTCSRKQIQDYWHSQIGESRLDYPGTCSTRLMNEIPQLEADGIQYSLRFRLQHQSMDFEDNFMGTESLDLSQSGGDTVVQRADGLLSYMLGCADDDSQVTHVLRGDDLLTSAARQLQIMQALERTPPRYAHIPMLMGENGRKLSKSTGDDDLAHYLDQGFDAKAVCSYLAWTLGMNEKGVRVGEHELPEKFDLEKISHQPWEFKVDDLEAFRN